MDFPESTVGSRDFQKSTAKMFARRGRGHKKKQFDFREVLLLSGLARAKIQIVRIKAFFLLLPRPRPTILNGMILVLVFVGSAATPPTAPMNHVKIFKERPPPRRPFGTCTTVVQKI